MQIYGDYHTHTYYSDGKGSMEDNVKAAASKGLKQIMISDHGFNRVIKYLKRDEIDELRVEADRLSKLYNIKVFIGVEANLISAEGDIDVTSEDMKKLDFIVCGFHKIIRPKKFMDYFRVFLPNYFYIISGFNPSEYRIKKNTEIYIKMLEKNKIDILAHPNHDFKIDVPAVARKAKEVGTLFEINGRRIEWSDNDVMQMNLDRIMFILSSDAHKGEQVGNVTRGENLIKKYNIDLNCIANLKEMPHFLNRKDGQA